MGFSITCPNNARTIRSYGAVGHEKELTGMIYLRK